MATKRVSLEDTMERGTLRYCSKKPYNQLKITITHKIGHGCILLEKMLPRELRIRIIKRMTSRKVK